MTDTAHENSPQSHSPALFFETAGAYQRSAALNAAVELDLFTAIGGGATAAEAAQTCAASERGIRILSDYLTIIGFLTKDGDRYALTPDSAMFLNKNSRAYLGGTLAFLNSPTVLGAFERLAEAVRTGGTALPGNGSVEDHHPIWADFARAMMPMMMMPALGVAQCVGHEPGRRVRVLDIAAGHGLYGIVLAQQNPNVEVVALDWPHVLEVATENARRMGVGDRYSTLPGSAFEVDFGTGYDVVLLTGFLHHFERSVCESLLKKVHGALAAGGGKAVTVDFVLNDDRISPPPAATFSLTMLATTPKGDAYTFREYDEMFHSAGFSRSELRPLPPGPMQAIVSDR